jgi:DtxR family transcriptional regulator, Mn-dependent transcriptional regulator
VAKSEEMALTGSLEDYLETIYLLIRDRKVARVKEIAEARTVKMSSVTPAMRRLDEMGLINYRQREFIELTPRGEKLARKTIARHDLLVRFFHNILRVSPKNAERDACSVEHILSDETTEKLVRFFEFLRCCPRTSAHFLETFHGCSVINPEVPECTEKCALHGRRSRARTRQGITSLDKLEPGSECTIVQITAKGAVRQRLIDMGMIPNTRVVLERKALGGNPIWIRLKGFQLSLRKEEAARVDVTTN